MAKRIGISKRVRFEIFKRDGFACRYCGGKPPVIPLEVDHIVPVSKGGGNEDENLITSCFDCNRGKSNKELSISPVNNLEVAIKKKLAQEQYKEIRKLREKERQIIDSEIDEVQNVFHVFYPDYSFSDKFRISVKNFITKLSLYEVTEAMEKSCGLMRDHHNALSYFCGICWNKIKGL